LAAPCWYRPDRAGRVLIGLTVLLVAATVWATADSESWRAFEDRDRNGPVRTIATFVLTAAVALLGVKRTRLAGILLLVLGVVPLAVSSFGHLTLGSLAVATTPALITGVLYLISASLDEGRTPDSQPPPKDRHLVG
jgi:peptidoglycan/LPS O-acetylase OafA/YrhL